MKLLLFLIFFQAKDTIPSVMGIFFYKNGDVIYLFNNQRSIIATMNNRFVKRKIDSVWLCNRGGNVFAAKPFRTYKFISK